MKTVYANFSTLKSNIFKCTVLTYLAWFLVIQSYEINYVCVISYSCDRKLYQWFSFPLHPKVDALDNTCVESVFIYANGSKKKYLKAQIVVSFHIKL